MTKLSENQRQFLILLFVLAGISIAAVGKPTASYAGYYFLVGISTAIATISAVANETNINGLSILVWAAFILNPYLWFGTACYWFGSCL